MAPRGNHPDGTRKHRLELRGSSSIPALCIEPSQLVGPDAMCPHRLSEIEASLATTSVPPRWHAVVRLVPARQPTVTSLQSESYFSRGHDRTLGRAAKCLGFRPRARAIFISDVHLGTRSAQADRLLDFLRHCEADSIYLVGDIVDFWKVRRGPHWPQPHNDVVQKLLRQARKGVRLVLVPGNHDEALRDYVGLRFGGIEIHQAIVHTTGKGRRYYVTHGDEFDIVVRTARWLALLGDHGYEFALWLNNPLNWCRRHLGLGYWSLSAYLKYRVKRAVAFIGAFEEAVAQETRRRGARRRDLRPHPSRLGPQLRRHPLSQLRRLGGKLHGHRRDARGRAAHRTLEGSPAGKNRPGGAGIG